MINISHEVETRAFYNAGIYEGSPSHKNRFWFVHDTFADVQRTIVAHVVLNITDKIRKEAHDKKKDKTQFI